MTQRASLAAAAVLIALVKAGEYAIDSQALFFFDSSSFILNALGLGFYPERSYVYGGLLRAVAVPLHSLHAIVAMQVVMGAVTAWLLAVLLIRFLRVRASIAILAALVFAVDPVQIVHEHMVMTETATLLAMAIFLLAALKYLRDPSPGWLAILSFLGILLVGLRIVYLPVVLACAALLPVFAYAFSSPRRPRVLAMALVVSCGSAALFHLGYRHLTGWLAGREPAYHYVTGFFLVSSVAPIVESGDSGDVRVEQAIVAQNRSVFPLGIRAFRQDQLWSPEGFAARLRTIFHGDERQADQAAQLLARAAILRNPRGFFMLGLHNYLDYWTGFRNLRFTLPLENGSSPTSQTGAFMARVIASAFGADVSNQHKLSTPSRRYQIRARYWYLFLLASPFLAGIALWLSLSHMSLSHMSLSHMGLSHSGPANLPGIAFLFSWNCLLLAATCLGGVTSAYRFLHPFSFLGLAAAAVLCEILARRFTYTFRRSPPAPGR